MSGFKKILFIASVITWLLSTSSLVLYGQTQIKRLHKHPVTFGFQTEKTLSFENAPILKKGKTRYNSSNGFTAKTQVIKHIKAEVGVNIPGLQTQPLTGSLLNSNSTSEKSQFISVPVNFQYYPLPRRCKVQPYCGVGIQYNSHPFTTANKGIEIVPATNNIESGTKYISLMFVQGVTYEINTRIQLTQTIHFIPESNSKTLGIGFGVGYTIP